MSKSALISVIIPAYNVEDYINDCIESVINQTYQNLEIIIINDGSTDRTLINVNRYSYDNRIAIIDNKNHGLTYSRQMGLDIAQGEFVCMLDSDDKLDINFIKILYEHISKDSSDIVSCNYSNFNKEIRKPNDQIASKKFIQVTNEFLESNYYKLIAEFLLFDSWAKLYRLQFIKESSVKFTLDKKYNGTDSLFNYLLLLHKPRLSLITETLYFHRIHSKSRVHRKDKKMLEGLQIIMNKILDECEKLNLNSAIYQVLSQIYVDFLFISVQDIFESNKGIRVIWKQLEEFISTNQIYLTDSSNIKIIPSNLVSINKVNFGRVINSKSISLLFIYALLRKIANKLI